MAPKGQLFRNGFWGHRFPPKNERNNSTELLWYLRSTCFCSFFGRIWRHQKNHFEIKWPLATKVTSSQKIKIMAKLVCQNLKNMRLKCTGFFSILLQLFEIDTFSSTFTSIIVVHSLHLLCSRFVGLKFSLGK